MRVNKTLVKSKKAVTLAIAGLLVVVLALYAMFVYPGWLVNKSEIKQEGLPAAATSSAKDGEKKVDNTSEKPSGDDGLSSDRPAQNTPQQSGKKAVSPIISSYGLSGDKANLEVSGGVNSVVENGGTCTYVVYWSGGSVTRTSTASAGPSSTDCHVVSFSLFGLPGNTEMSVKVAYSSNTSSGESTNGPSFKKEDLR